MLPEPELRARVSGGASNSVALYELVRQFVVSRQAGIGILADVGCGEGNLQRYLGEYMARYIGVDLVRYVEFPVSANVDFCLVDLNSSSWPLPDGLADVVCSVETIEHVENPRAFMRELVRIARPGGLLVVTTPNQLSLLSKICLLLKNQFVHFQERPGLYPAHLSALLEVDLTRLARENGLTEVEIVYTGDGRIPSVSRHWPRWLASQRGRRGRAFSDNVMLVAQKPAA